ncbi:hypothetical protein M407DRAFT_29147 [Tulasnella calospora MUT 4182]|uniref:Uncharacterized protein n=1 Tax=Tulasnella calospora MUT 4182 TaxID=1051891 RepID=A0A0C3KI93_9AGAM|nr:hypothetical protein M407DRAFT_29147 [Tulasnella calospora MUT 4182]
MQHPRPLHVNKPSGIPEAISETTLPSSISRYDRPVGNWVEPRADIRAPNIGLPTNSEHNDGRWIAFEHVTPEVDSYFRHDQHHVATLSPIQTHRSPTLVESYRNKIQALQRWTKSLLYHRPIRGYARLATSLRNRFIRRGVDKDEGAQETTYSTSHSL